MTSPSAERSELHDIDDAVACAFVDDVLGAAEEWRSLIIRYRLSSDFQAHWKAEIGHWIIRPALTAMAAGSSSARKRARTTRSAGYQTP